MIKRINTPVFSILAMLLGFCLQAQEQLMPLSVNPQLMSVPAAVKNGQASRTATVAVLDLPFFEDFSYSATSPYPSVNYWLDSSVFINHTFPIAPPSIGVATFDGLNKKGYPYNLSALVSNSSPADKLTSKPINLKIAGTYTYQPSDSVYLSFYYQAEGRGDAPEANDSLSVDFFKPGQNKWVKVWGAKGYNPGSNDTLFHRVMIRLDSVAYFDSLFQFRFRNRATLSGSLDHWHVDYIYMNKLRTFDDTIRDDYAFEYMSKPLLKNYSTMPYRQYQSSEMAPKLFTYIRNNAERGVGTGPNLSYSYDIYKDNIPLPVANYPYATGNVYPYSQIGTDTVQGHCKSIISYTIPAITDPTIFTIKHYFKTDQTGTDFEQKNDTILQTQRFSDYYAYDDGTAEVGYYNNTYGAKNAVRYTINVADTLKAMRVYFDPITDGQNIINSSFRLMVWADGNNGPGNVLYRDSAMLPQYLQGNYNTIPVYNLTSCFLLTPGTYYFGIQQTTNKPLNVGFDKNNNHANALYYDIGNGWVQSSIKGSIMINPLLGCALDPLPVSIQKHSNEASYMSVYPNPAQNSFKIETNGLVLENASVTILSSIGQTVYSTSYNSHESIDVSNLPNGIYFIQLSSSELNATPQKLIISR